MVKSILTFNIFVVLCLCASSNFIFQSATLSSVIAAVFLTPSDMARRNRNNGIPDGWQGCPSMGTGFVDERFFVFKTPLKAELNNKVPKTERHSIENICQRVNQMNNSRIGLWIDLTNTARYYNPSQIQNRGIQYEKLSCEGHGRPPSKKSVTAFCNMVNYFFRRNRQDYVGVHCTHGFNRTGYLICYYLIKFRKYSAAQAVFEFSRHRHPGIYRQGYVDDLYTMSMPREAPIRVSEPDWLRPSHQQHSVRPVHSSSNEGERPNFLTRTNSSEVKEPSESHTQSQSSSVSLLPTPTTVMDICSRPPKASSTKQCQL